MLNFVRSGSIGMFASTLLGCAMFAQTQGTLAGQEAPAGEAAGRRVLLDVVVTPKSGGPVAGLSEKDFTLLDNNAVQPLTSFRALSGKQAPIEVVLLIDAVNTGVESIAYERQQIERFLKRNGGQLAQPMALAVLTDTGTQIQEGFSTDGNAMSAVLDKYTIGLRSIRRSSGYYGAEERLQISLKTINELAAREGARPGRKMILWVSPGWPLLSGPGTMLDSKQQAAIFRDVVNLSNVLRRSGITLYSIDPLGTADAGTLRISYYREFLKV